MEKDKLCGIYKIANKINGKIYIGQSTDIKARWYDHKIASTNSKGPKYFYDLYMDMRKFGLSEFTFEIVELCPQFQLNEKESYWIDYFDSYETGYNKTLGGGFQKEKPWSKVSKEKTKRIINFLETTKITQAEIALLENTSAATVSLINNGKAGYNEYAKEKKFPIRERVDKNTHVCKECGKTIRKTHNLCKTCYDKIRKKPSRIPTKNELKELILKKSFVEIGRLFNTSDNTVRKWCMKYDLPYRRNDIKKLKEKLKNNL